MEKPVLALKHLITKCLHGTTNLFAFGILTIAFFCQSNIAFAEIIDLNTLTLCNDVTDGGEVTGNESGCNNPIFDPSIITSVTLPSGGGTDPIEYLWIYTNDDPNGTFAIWHPIPGSSDPFYDPGPISETTYYRRCAKRAGCPEFVTESNWICKEVNCALPNIGDTVFVDENGNGIQDPGEAGIANIKVKLMTAGADGAFCTPDDVMETMQFTDSNGNYLFTDVQPGTYYIDFCTDNLPTGYSFTNANQGTNDDLDSDADPETGKTNVFTVNYGDEDDLSYDAGVVVDKIKVGDTVFSDTDQDGIQDAGEAGVPNVKVKLFSLGADGVYCTDDDVMEEMMFTDGNGNYQFMVCAPGTYYVQFCELPTGFIFTSNEQGGNDDLDSDADPTTGKTPPFTVNPGDPDITDIDAGIIPACNVVFTITSTNPTCNGANNGTATVNVNSGTAPFTYSWSESFGTASTASGIGGGTVCVTVTDANGCVATNCAEFYEPEPFEIVGTTTDATCGDTNGSIMITGAIASVVWNNGATTNTINNLAAGQYCATATGYNGCISQKCFNVGTTGDLNFTLNKHDANCVGGSDGSAFVVVLSGTAPYTYVWSNGAATAAINDVTPGEYCVTVTDAAGCQNAKCTTIGAPTAIAIDGSTDDATCGQDNGNVSINVAGGTAPYTFIWNGVPTLNSEDLVDVPAGPYTVFVTDSRGCTAEAEFGVGQKGLTSISVHAFDATCSNLNNGTAVVSLTAGSQESPYTFDWSNGTITTNGDIANLVPGDYCVTATDALGCEAVDCFEILGPDAIQIEGTVIDAACGASNGSITTQITSGTGPFTYAWDHGPITSSISNLAAAEYCVEVSTTSLCVSRKCFTVNGGSDITLNLNASDPTCSDSNDGSVTATTSGGTAPISIVWSNTSTGGMVNGLGAGEICATATDANGCTMTQCVTLVAPTSILVIPEISHATCGESNGSIGFAVFGGTGIKSYDWGIGQFGPAIINLAPGEYCITVTDENNCALEECYTINGESDIVLDLNSTNPTCFDSNDGAVMATTTGGTAPVSFTWSNGGLDNNVTGLGAGEICATATDNNGCTMTQCVTLVAPTEIDFNIFSQDATCGLNNGQAFADGNTLNGGTPPYSLLWNNGATTYIINDLASGEYCVTITDANGCTKALCTEVEDIPSFGVTSTISDPTCGQANGSVTIEAVGGTTPITYNWNVSGNTATLNNLNGGTYCVTITDANGCTYEDCATLNETSQVVFDFTKTPSTCGQANGSITVDPVRGVAPFTYLWEDGSVSATRSNLAASSVAEYCVTVTDANGCTHDDCFDLDGTTSNLTVGVTIYSSTCDEANGSITARGLDGVAPYNYVWNTGATTDELLNILGGIEYCVTITDATGCTAAECWTPDNLPDVDLEITFTNPTCHDSNDGTATAIASNGTGPFNFVWNDLSTGNSIVGLGNGEVCVTVVDDADCTITKCVTLIAPTALTFGLGVGSANCDMNNGSANVNNVTGGTAPYTYNWSNGAMTPILANLSAAEYCVTVTDAMGCTETACGTVVDVPGFDLGISGVNPTCGENNGSVTVSPNGVGTYTYEWNVTGSSPTITGLGAGQYCVTVTDQIGCSSDLCFELIGSEGPTLNGSATNTTCGEDNGSATATANGGATPYTYLWTGGATGNSINNLAAGTYCVTVTDANGCIEDMCYDVQDSNPSIVTLFGPAPICPGESDVIEIISVIGAGTTYAWSSNGGVLDSATGSTNNFTSNTPGTYTITVVCTDANGCTATDMVDIVVKTPTECGMEDKVNIGNYVWFDFNENGTQDTFEQGIENIKVKLISAGTDGMFNTADDVVVDMQMTDALGYYLFECVEPGEYIIEFCLDSLPVDTKITTQNTGGDDAIDSDADMMTGQTDPFTVVAGQDDDLSFDAGIIIDEDGPCDNIVSGGEICCDQVLCGAGATADPITSVTVASGGSGTLEYLWMMTNNPGPFDPNTWTVIPGATSVDYAPGPVFQTTYYARCARRAGCTGYLEANIITIEIKDLPKAEIVGLPAVNCKDESISFSAADGGVAATYAWDFGVDANPATFNGRNVSGVSWSSVGTKTITLTVTRLGCTRTTTQDIIVEDCSGSRFMRFVANAAADEQVELEWETNEELNDFVFVIEHSMDGEEFKIISDMQGKLAGQGSKTYEFMHKEARPGRNYYKVKHIDFTGESVSTDEEMIIIHENERQKFILFPVPTIDVVNFESLKLTDETGLIQVVDAYGHTLDELVIPANTKRMQVDLSSYPTGAYFLYIKYDSVRMRAHKVMKTRD